MKLNDNLRLDLTMAALAHPIRRTILERVMLRETCVTELAEPFAMSLNAVSKHIRILERAHLVQRRRVWREHLVSFRPGPLEEAAEWRRREARLAARVDKGRATQSRAASSRSPKRNRARTGLL